MDCSPPSSSVHGIFQARVLERVSFPPPGIFPTQNQTRVFRIPYTGRQNFLSHCTTWEAKDNAAFGNSAQDGRGMKRFSEHSSLELWGLCWQYRRAACLWVLPKGSEVLIPCSPCIHHQHFIFLQKRIRGNWMTIQKSCLEESWNPNAAS